MELIPVQVACGCADTPHSEDTISLRPWLGLAAGVAIERAVRDFWVAKGRSREDAILGALVEYYLLYGVAEWTMVDAKGEPIDVTQENIAEYLLSDYSRAKPVADRADELYKGPILDPLLSRAKSSSRGTSTNGSISARHPTTSKPRKRSKPSSTTTIPTADTATTSP